VNNTAEINHVFLKSIIERFGVAQIEDFYSSSIFYEYLDSLDNPIGNNIWGRVFRKEIINGNFFYNNKFINDVLLPQVFNILNQNDFDLISIPVGFLPIRRFNAISILGEKNEKAILMDISLGWFLDRLFKMYLIYTYWDVIPRISDKYKKTDFETGLKYLVESITIYDKDKHVYIDEICNMTSVFDDSIYGFSIRTQIFILLHEYSHFILQHFDKSEIIKYNLNNEISQSGFSYNLNQEFEADENSFKHILRNINDIDDLKGYTISLGVFFNILDLFETNNGKPTTHPPSFKRWEMLKYLINLLDNVIDSRFINRIEYPFQRLKTVPNTQ